jgi:hypothetical protein
MIFKVCFHIGEVYKMSRNAIKSIENIFGILQSQIDQENLYRINPAIRIINLPLVNPKTNVDMLINSSIKSEIKLYGNERIFGIQYYQRNFVLIPESSDLQNGFVPGIFTNVLLEDDEISNGISLMALSENLISLINSDALSLELIENIFALEPLEGKVHYNLEQIKRFFKEFEVWEVDSQFYDINQKNDLYRIYCNYQLSKKILESENTIVLNFNSDTTEAIKDILVSLNSQYVADVIYKAITANHWEHCFLELYRCIENLYLIYHIDLLTNQLSDEALKIAIGLDSIGFRSTERLDVRKLFEKLTTSTEQLKILRNCFNGSSGEQQEALEEEEAEKLKEKMADKFYDIRCSIAHLKYKHNYPAFNENDWNSLITTICVVIRELYEIYGERLASIIES